VVAFCPDVFQSTPGLINRLFDALPKAAEWDSPWTAPLPKDRERNSMIVLRALANIFQDGVDVDGTWLAQVCCDYLARLP